LMHPSPLVTAVTAVDLTKLRVLMQRP